MGHPHGDIKEWNLTSNKTAATTVPISVELFVACPLKIHDTLLTMPMIPSPMMIRVSSWHRSTRCVYLKLTTRQTIAMRKIASPSTMVKINLLSVNSRAALL